MKLSVIMPVYNEVATIGEIIRRVMNVDIPKELIIVDDGSTDGTRDVLRDIARTRPPASEIRIFFHRCNRGKGAAIRTGLKYFSGDIVIIQDADLEYYPEEYHDVLRPILNGKADVVYGSRFLGTHRVYMFTHYLGNLVLNCIANVLYNTMLTDMETCYKAFRADAIRGIRLRSEGFGFEPEITARIFQRHLRVYETPISYSGRTYEEGKKITWKDGVKTLYWLIACKFLDRDISKEMPTRIAVLGKYTRWLFSQISPYVGNRVLDVGSGVGNIVRLLVGKPLLVASDASSEYVDYLKNHFVESDRFKIVRYNLNDPPPEELKRQHFDTVLCLNLLEHLEDDSKAIAHLTELVAPGGNIVLLVPAYSSIYSHIDEGLGHRRRYDARRLKRLLKQDGLAITSFKYLNMAGAIGWLVNGRLLRARRFPARQTKVFDLLTPLLKLETLLRAPWGFSLLAVAERVS